MDLTVTTLKATHAHCLHNKAEVIASTECGCFYCKETFPPPEVKDWVLEEPPSALCPRCGIDSVIGNASGYPIDSEAFLQAMHDYWFEKTVRL